MFDSYKRDITYLRVSVTDKCNLRCVYCMPADGVPPRKHSDFLSLEEIASVVRASTELGFRKVRLTGGEPLVKKGIVDLVGMIKSIPAVQVLGMTTNGVLLETFAEDLRRAGLDSVNISLDTLDPDRYRAVTRGGDIRCTLEGIEAAVSVGFAVKINTVVMEDTPAEDIDALNDFCRSKALSLQLINHYSLTREKLDRYRFDRPPDCRTCNRIRLTADGYLKPCLHSNLEIPVDRNNIVQSLRETVSAKPERGMTCTNRSMMEIGG
ncbi:MAG: radical SAM protein [Spirochaetales bacterium]|nr:radical SAM protein [Spirochaetales bacterium]